MSREHLYYVYLLASRPQGTLYVGMTNDLPRRLLEHRRGEGSAPTRRYDVKMLVWYEQHGDVRVALVRERAVKKWNRAWKVRLLEESNPRWADLAAEIGVEPWEGLERQRRRRPPPEG